MTSAMPFESALAFSAPVCTLKRLPSTARMRSRNSVVGDAGLGLHVDLRVLALEAVPALRVASGIERDERAAERGRRADLVDADDAQALEAVQRHEPDGVADVRVGLVGRVLDQRDLARPRGAVPADVRGRVEARRRGGEHERGSSAGRADGLGRAVLEHDQRAERVDLARRRRDARHLADALQHRVRRTAPGSRRWCRSTVRSSTTTSFLTLTASKISLNARSIWPVTTNVPEIIATPSTIENAVSRARRGRARRLANVRPSIGRYSSDLI